MSFTGTMRTAEEQNAYHKGLYTYVRSVRTRRPGDGLLPSEQQANYSGSFYMHNDGDGGSWSNFYLDASESPAPGPDSARYKVFKDGVKIFETYREDYDGPDVEYASVPYNRSGDKFYLFLDEGSYSWTAVFKWKTQFGINAAYWELGAKQGQTQASSGDRVRVWKEDFSELEEEFATLLTNDLADSGRLGYEVT